MDFHLQLSNEKKRKQKKKTIERTDKWHSSIERNERSHEIYTDETQTNKDEVSNGYLSPHIITTRYLRRQWCDWPWSEARKVSRKLYNVNATLRSLLPTHRSIELRQFWWSFQWVNQFMKYKCPRTNSLSLRSRTIYLFRHTKLRIA